MSLRASAPHSDIDSSGRDGKPQRPVVPSESASVEVESVSPGVARSMGGGANGVGKASNVEGPSDVGEPSGIGVISGIASTSSLPTLEALVA